MKKIWDAQNGQALYAIDEEALHNRVLNKKDKAAKIASWTEWMLIGSLLFSTGIIMTAAIYKSKYEMVPMAMAALMAIVSAIIYQRRVKRLSWQNNFENSIIGNMDQALANADYQVKLSRSVRWLLLAVAGLTVAGLIASGAQWWTGALVALFFVVVYYGARWEYRTFYVSQKKNLQDMRNKLETWKDSDIDHSEYDGLI